MARSVSQIAASSQPREPQARTAGCDATETNREGRVMGKGILLWLLGIPIPIIILLLIFWH